MFGYVTHCIPERREPDRLFFAKKKKKNHHDTLSGNVTEVYLQFLCRAPMTHFAVPPIDL